MADQNGTNGANGTQLNQGGSTQIGSKSPLGDGSKGPNQTDAGATHTNAQLTTNQGRPIGDNQNSVTAGRRGPITLDDFQLLEKMTQFNRERIPERVVHAKGSGAHTAPSSSRMTSRSTPKPPSSRRSATPAPPSPASPPSAERRARPIPLATPAASP